MRHITPKMPKMSNIDQKTAYLCLIKHKWMDELCHSVEVIASPSTSSESPIDVVGAVFLR
jgi:hypothetical protein